jgi:DNA-binding NtrC family response regulator
LREHTEDIPELIERCSPFLFREIPEKTLRRLTNFCWPGNIRQLKNVFQRAEVRGAADLDGRDILDDEVCPENCRQNECLYRDRRAWANLAKDSSEPSADEKTRIIDALRLCDWNVTAAANKLGLHRVTLSKKLSEMQIRKLYS